MAKCAEPRPWRRGLLWLLLLGPFFLISYSFATWVTAQRSDVGVVVFAWEYDIPFWPWTIVPYWLIDLLYALSLLLCATRFLLDNHAKRLLTAEPALREMSPGHTVACWKAPIDRATA